MIFGYHHLTAQFDTLDKNTNPAFEHCDAEYWLAYKDGKLAGRIAGIINHLANEKWGKKVRFGWIDFVDDEEVAQALLGAVEEWGRSKGMSAITGPLGFNDMDNEGMLVEGFDKLPTISNIYNYPYYPQHLETLGYHREEDWLQFKFNASQPVPEKMERINKLIAEKYNLQVLTLSIPRIYYLMLSRSFIPSMRLLRAIWLFTTDRAGDCQPDKAVFLICQS